MCGRIVHTLPPEAMRSLLRTRNLLDSVPRYNIAPTQPLIAVWEESGHREAKLARWGLVPRWVKDPRDFPLIINARAETMAEKPAFRDSLKHQRCAVPASGYYEWRTDPAGRKHPYFITYGDHRPMIMAGLYATWTGPQGEEFDSLAIITVPANTDLAHIHDRMPALIEGDGIERWLDVRTVRANEAVSVIGPAPEGTMAAHPVSPRVNSARNEGPDLIVPVPEDPFAAASPKPLKEKAKNPQQFDLF
ncbi:SOS response-associated peptidase [Pelagibacterium limicola]|uniref:SOS response-associated peptidase n=1 Tax=Pelagibacterium limicola TaxID=2791022 RepID=UPI0018AFC4CB|nr:SOS response-associated peptidase [Pelagibacterium limicola]